MAANQDERTLQVATPLPRNYLLIDNLRCDEGLNQLFRIDLELLHEETTEGLTATEIDPKKLVGNPMVVVAQQSGGVERYFHGICINFTQGNRSGWFSRYRAELVPKVWLLTQVSQSRIFQNKSVPEILKEILAGFEFDSEIQGTFKPRNYCVQYRESDWDFACRLMEEEGIYYYFDHTADSHRLILANTPASHRPCPTRPKLAFDLDRSELKEEWIPAVYSWRVDSKMATGRFETRDFNFQLPTNDLLAIHTSLLNTGNNKELAHYEWPGGYAKRFDGIDADGAENRSAFDDIFEDRERTVRIRQEEIDVGYKDISGTSDCSALTAGYRFELEHHPHSANNINHVLVRVQHEAVQSPDYTTGDRVSHAYAVNFLCVPHGAGHPPFRPARKTPKPVVQGSQTAIVVGPPGEEIFTDKYGRVKVQFHWDRRGKMNSSSSCWLRVAQIWAGNGWGSIFIPRVGMEVLVNFMEGDPDQPMIAGCVYNPANMPPYKLPDHKTRSTLKSNSSKGNGGFNEFRFEDKKGSEQIFIHAQKNEDIRVNNECMETIGANRHLIVGGNQLEKVHGDKHLKVAGDKREKIEGDTSLIVSGDYDMRSTAANVEATVIHLKGKKIVIDAENELSLKSGSGFISIKKDGTVTISGMKVLINSGGSAGSAADCSPTAPKSPKEADKADGGKSIEPPSAPPPPPSPQLAKLKIAAKKVRKKKDRGRPAPFTPEEEKLLIASWKKEAEERVNREEEAKKQGIDLLMASIEESADRDEEEASKAINALVAAQDGLPFIKKSDPAPPGKTPKILDDYYQSERLGGRKP